MDDGRRKIRFTDDDNVDIILFIRSLDKSSRSNTWNFYNRILSTNNSRLTYYYETEQLNESILRTGFL